MEALLHDNDAAGAFAVQAVQNVVLEDAAT